MDWNTPDTDAAFQLSRRLLKNTLDLIDSLPNLSEDEKGKIDEYLDKLKEVDSEMVKEERALAELRRPPQDDEVGTYEDMMRQFNEKIASYPDEVGEFADRVEAARSYTHRHMEVVDGEEVELDGDDIAVDIVVLDLKDPITKEIIVNPVKNKWCNHVYERDAALNYIEQHRRNHMAIFQCPVAMCSNKRNLNEADLVEFPEFFERVQEQEEQTRRRRNRLARGQED